MDTSTPVDAGLAVRQWDTLRQTYARLGHTVELVDPVAGLPDMVYAANGGLIVNGTAVVARFAYPQRAGEADAYGQWMADHGFETAHTQHTNEGQGDLLVVGSTVLAGHGFRTDIRAHDEVAAIVGMPVVSLELIDPRFYHLDTALAVLDDDTIAYYPPAFSETARARLQGTVPRRHRGRHRRRLRRWDSTPCPTACTSCTPRRPPALPSQLADAGFEPDRR